jgi:hypothetical protein
VPDLLRALWWGNQHGADARSFSVRRVAARKPDAQAKRSATQKSMRKRGTTGIQAGSAALAHQTLLCRENQAGACLNLWHCDSKDSEGIAGLGEPHSQTTTAASARYRKALAEIADQLS